MATHQKPKKGGFMTFYRSITGSGNKPNHIPRSEFPPEAPGNYDSSPQVHPTEEPRRSLASAGDHYGMRRSVDGRGGEREDGDRIVAGRRSVSHVEMNLESAAAMLQVKVMVCDMPGFMQVHAFRCARRSYDSLEKFSSKYMAHSIKKEFDKVYGPAWHCIVGSNFGSFVTHSTGCFIYFSIEKLYILLFKTKVKKALD